jgi:ATP-dependent DNA ligase
MSDTLTTQPRAIDGAFNAPELCMLAQTALVIDDNREWLVQLKHDGIRALAIGNQLVTREGTPFGAAMHCVPDLARLAHLYGQPMMFDGEYVEPGGYRATLSAFRSGHGTGPIYLFDAVPLSDWRTGRCTMSTRMRLDLLAAHVDRGRFRHLDVVRFVPMIGRDRIMGQAHLIWDKGHEGLVIKGPLSPYVRRRSTDWIKIKQKETAPCA